MMIDELRPFLKRNYFKIKIIEKKKQFSIDNIDLFLEQRDFTQWRLSAGDEQLREGSQPGESLHLRHHHHLP